MFNLFKKKCPVCRMGLKAGEYYPKGADKEFCSEECRETYRKNLVKEQSKSGKSCCG